MTGLDDEPSLPSLSGSDGSVIGKEALIARGWSAGMVRRLLPAGKAHSVAQAAKVETSEEFAAQLGNARQARAITAAHQAKIAARSQRRRISKKNRAAAEEQRRLARERKLALHAEERRVAEQVRKQRRTELGVRVSVRDRSTPPARVTLHLGPTNSGKTHDALESLAAAKTGTYAAPLRMLADEAYHTLSDRLGADHVGLVTGEEQINPDAPIICCTAEMAPLSGQTLVIDEAHWIGDADRGYAWTRLVVGADYAETHVIAVTEAEDFFRRAYADAGDLAVMRCERRSALSYIGDVTASEIKPGTVVVAFSRSAVHAIARDLTDHGLRTGALYGALPPGARRDQIARFGSGNTDVLVTTDVIGHGINLPCTTVLLAETTKFDGKERRELHQWEATQIVGRAGRNRELGAVGVYRRSGLHCRAKLVRAAVQAANGAIRSGLRLSNATLRPTHADLGYAGSDTLSEALRLWRQEAKRRLSGDHTWLRPILIDDMLARADIVGQATAAASGAALTAAQAWSLVTMPIDVSRDRMTFEAIVRAAVAGGTGLCRYLNRPVSTLQAAENAARDARNMMAATRALCTPESPELGGITWQQSVAAERRASKAVTKLLPDAVRTSHAGRCTSCGKPCPPWFTQCDNCHFRSWDDDWDDWEVTWANPQYEQPPHPKHSVSPTRAAAPPSAAPADLSRCTVDRAWVTRPMLRVRGWTDAGEKRFLPRPEGTVANPYYRSAAPMPVWTPATVLAVENTAEWQEWLSKSLRRRKTTIQDLAAAVDERLGAKLAHLDSLRVTEGTP